MIKRLIRILNTAPPKPEPHSIEDIVYSWNLSFNMSTTLACVLESEMTDQDWINVRAAIKRELNFIHKHDLKSLYFYNKKLCVIRDQPHWTAVLKSRDITDRFISHYVESMYKLQDCKDLDKYTVMLRDLSYAIKNQLNSHYASLHTAPVVAMTATGI